MPEITLNIPSNSRFHSSLNEIDLAMNAILLKMMRLADPRSILGIQDVNADETKDDWLWDYSRVFQVDELSTEEIFNTYLLRKNINNKKGTDVLFPLCAFKQEDVETVFWGTGNRFRQWNFEIPSPPESWEKGDTVFITAPLKYRALQGEIYDTKAENGTLYCSIIINGRVITEPGQYKKPEVVWFPVEDLRPTGNKIPHTYKAKAITGTYSVVILCDNKDELQYIRDKYFLRVTDANIWFTYASPTLNGSENQIYTVFDRANIERYPSSADKLKGQGYIYGSSFVVHYWGCLADTPLPQSLIEMIRMNIHVEKDGPTNRIVIN